VIVAMFGAIAVAFWIWATWGGIVLVFRVLRWVATNPLALAGAIIVAAYAAAATGVIR
jgi:hypothetical protein